MAISALSRLRPARVGEPGTIPRPFAGIAATPAGGVSRSANRAARTPGETAAPARVRNTADGPRPSSSLYDLFRNRRRQALPPPCPAAEFLLSRSPAGGNRRSPRRQRMDLALHA